ncbi:MAG: hypothetical protein E6089_00255 [Enterobacter sp.]|nr:hypothetical protein [Pseudescherichia vulneris]MDU5512490.1 hypothetical protein [Enterobacter sp.]
MNLKLIFSISVMFLSILWLLIVVSFFMDYKRYSKRLAGIFQLLKDNKLLHDNDYQTLEMLGFWGFGARVMVLFLIVKGKRVKLTHTRWLEPEACQVLLRGVNLAWVKNYGCKVKLGSVLLCILLILSFVGYKY